MVPSATARPYRRVLERYASQALSGCEAALLGDRPPRLAIETFFAMLVAEAVGDSAAQRLSDRQRRA